MTGLRQLWVTPSVSLCGVEDGETGGARNDICHMRCLSEGMLKVLLFLLVMVLLFLLYIELFSIKNYSEMYFAAFL